MGWSFSAVVAILAIPAAMAAVSIVSTKAQPRAAIA
jgi:AAHS family 4-hydroxybenzoate transporter-like MFS transporter